MKIVCNFNSTIATINKKSANKQKRQKKQKTQYAIQGHLS